MKKKYISPEIKLMKLPTENVMAALSKVEQNTFDGNKDDGLNIGSDIGTWDGNSQPESAKGNNSFGFWDDEE